METSAFAVRIQMWFSAALCGFSKPVLSGEPFTIHSHKHTPIHGGSWDFVCVCVDAFGASLMHRNSASHCEWEHNGKKRERMPRQSSPFKERNHPPWKPHSSRPTIFQPSVDYCQRLAAQSCPWKIVWTNSNWIFQFVQINIRLRCRKALATVGIVLIPKQY